MSFSMSRILLFVAVLTHRNVVEAGPIYGACYDVLSHYPIDSYVPFVSPQVGAGAAFVAFFYLATATWTILWVKYQRKQAEVRKLSNDFTFLFCKYVY